jgi:hypothetical protein
MRIHDETSAQNPGAPALDPVTNPDVSTPSKKRKFDDSNEDKPKGPTIKKAGKVSVDGSWINPGTNHGTIVDTFRNYPLICIGHSQYSLNETNILLAAWTQGDRS